MRLTTAPPVRPPTARSAIRALDDPMSASCSPESAADVDMQDSIWVRHSGDEMVSDIRYRHMKGSDVGPLLRGSLLHRRPPDIAWIRKAVSSGPESPQSEEQDQEEEGEIDHEGADNVSEEDGYSTSSDWDSYGDLSLLMDEYEDVVARLEGSEDWNEDQKKLHKLIYMRGLHPMMPSWWRVSFRMWGVTQPHLDDVFTPKHSNKRVAIHAYGNEIAATKALESLFYLSQTVTDYEEIGYQSKISATVVRGIKGYIKWAMQDAKIDRSRTLLNMFVRAYPPDFRGDDGFESDESDFAPSVGSDPDKEAETPAEDRERADELTEAQRARRFTRAVSRDLERRLLDLGQRWRDLLRRPRGKGFIAQPPTLYAFAVVQHIVMLASHDSSSPTKPVVVLEQIRLNDRGQWLWNALSIALPVNMARDALNTMWDNGVIVAEHDDPDSDPDL